jgi:shikimate kinase
MKRIYLIGYMGSGKSKTAEALAKQLGFTVFDIDKKIEEQTGKSISTIFETEGQEAFRELERDALRSTASMEMVVVSTGGGTPCYHDNMTWMNEHGITVYLDANPGLLFHRLAGNKKGRPLIENLSDVELMEQITGHLATRLPVYRQAKITVPAASLDVKGLSEKISPLFFEK